MTMINKCKLEYNQPMWKKYSKILILDSSEYKKDFNHQFKFKTQLISFKSGSLGSLCLKSSHFGL